MESDLDNFWNDMETDVLGEIIIIKYLDFIICIYIYLCAYYFINDEIKYHLDYLFEF